MKKYITIVVLLLFIKVGKAQNNKFDFYLHFNPSLSNVYKLNNNMAHSNSFQYKTGLQMSYNLFPSDKHYIDLGIFYTRMGFSDTLTFHTDSLLQNPVLVRFITSYLYLDIPISYTYIHSYDKNISPFFSIGISNLFMFGLVSNAKNYPDSIRGHPINPYQNYKQIGFSKIITNTAFRIYNTGIRLDIGAKIKLSNKIHIKISLNYSSNVFPNGKNDKLTDTHHILVNYFYAVNFSIGF